MNRSVQQGNRPLLQSRKNTSSPMAVYYQQRVSLSQNCWEKKAITMMIQLCQWQMSSNE
ncbi:hypothetical protein [Vibrio cincinnatiensis]|uniref:hypothetical protein n=1 Tax=Vibrio cincinnatiensis TaxID=675 RepID=UPI001EDD5FF2|nr:hypothetical protein [Vibrio cincinnatiensis]